MKYLFRFWLLLLIIMGNTTIGAAACKSSRFALGPDERRAAFNRRLAADYLRTLQQPINILPLENNGDEVNVPFFAAQFSKSLQHDANGLLTAQGQQSYQQLVTAMSTGKQADFNAIVRAPGATMKLVNPQGGLAFSMQGADSSLFKIPLFPVLSSPEMAALMIENYLMELCRDVLFSDYGTGLGTDTPGLGASSSKTNDAAAVLQSLGVAYTGPRNSGVVDANVLFRGNSFGDLIGPMVSQFLIQPIKTVAPGVFINTPPFLIYNQQRPIASSREFNIIFTDFVTLQNGAVPRPYLASDFDLINARYMVTGRDIGSYVHWDVDYEAFYNAAYILAEFGFPFSTNLPYFNGNITNEVPFVTMGIIDVFGLIGGVATEALKACWAQKWRASRVGRPECTSGLIHRAVVTGTNPFNLNASLFVPHAGVDVLANTLAHNQAQAGLPGNTFTVGEASTYLLSQMYPEACPSHPSYPSGHAAIAGACVTVIKAIWEDTTLLNTKFAPQKPTPGAPTTLTALTPSEGSTIMTVASELDKLASNICYPRNWAGIHYRADAEQGILLGEAVAIKYLQDQACTYTEQGFAGYVLTKRDGTRIRITSETVEIIAI